MSETAAGVERRRHRWNEHFHWVDHDPDAATTITAEQVRQFDEKGFFVIPGAFDRQTLARLDEEIAPLEARVRDFLGELPDGRLSVSGVDTQTVAPHMVLGSDYLREFVANPLLAGVCRDLIGPDVRLYWEQAVYKQPHSAEPVLWHQDNGYTFVEPQAYLTCWIAITDATPENGCVCAVPGVHRNGTLAHRTTDIGMECWGDPDTAVEVPVTAGDVVVFTSLTPHFTAHNRTDEVRKAYIVQYCHDGAVAHHPRRRRLEGRPDSPERPRPSVPRGRRRATRGLTMLGHIVAEAARRFGDEIAYDGWDETLSYRELDQRSDGAAGGLRRAGVEEGDVVVLRMPSGADYLISYAAISKIGAIAAGINPKLAEAEQDALEARVEPAVTLTEAPASADAPAIVEPDPERRSVIVFTSGTTGLPRGAVFGERELDAIARIDRAEASSTWGGGGPMLASTQFAHIGFMTKLPWYLQAGSRIVTLERWRADDVLPRPWSTTAWPRSGAWRPKSRSSSGRRSSKNSTSLR